MGSRVYGLCENQLEHLIFVYGTLKQGHINSVHMLQQDCGRAVYMGLAMTNEPYPLVMTKSGHWPFLLPVPGLGKVNQLILSSIYINNYNE